MEDVAAPRVNLDNLLGMAKTAEEAKNNAEATQYYNRVLEIDPTIYEAWLGKGRAAGWQSTLSAPRIDEMMVAFRNAIECVRSELQTPVAEIAGVTASSIVQAVYELADNHHREHGSLPGVRATYLQISGNLLGALATAGQWSPGFRPLLNLKVRIACDLLNLGLDEPWKTSVKAQLDNAVAEIEAAEPHYVRPALAARTTVQAEQASADGAAIGYFLAAILAVVVTLIAVATRGE